MAEGFNQDTFFDILANKDLSETDLAVYFVWYLMKYTESNHSVSLDSIMDMFRSSRLRGSVNKSRLKINLTRDKRCIWLDGEYQIRRGFEKEADLEFGLITDTPHEPQAEITNQIFDKRSGFFDEISREINSSYELRNFNSCAVMARRMVESLIIECYLFGGFKEEIKQNNDFIMLDSLIGKISSGQHFELSRDSKRTLRKIKELGDKAAHSRTYIVKKIDIDDIALQFRSVVHELSSILQ